MRGCGDAGMREFNSQGGVLNLLIDQGCVVYVMIRYLFVFSRALAP